MESRASIWGPSQNPAIAAASRNSHGYTASVFHRIFCGPRSCRASPPRLKGHMRRVNRRKHRLSGALQART